MTDTPLDYQAIRKRAEGGDPSDEWDDAIVLRLLDVINQLTRQRNTATASCDRIADRAIHLRAELNQARTQLVDDAQAAELLDQWLAYHACEPGAENVAAARQLLGAGEK